jgi:hypothetical protein
MSIVLALLTFARVDRVFEDCGAGQALAKIVLKDIWHGALAALKLAKMCLFDITECTVQHRHRCQPHERQTDRLESCMAIGECAILSSASGRPERKHLLLTKCIAAGS